VTPKPLLACCLVLALLPSHDDVYVLSGGDRVTGKTVLKGKTSFTVQTAYGRLTVPRAKIERILWGDGHEEVLNAPPEPSPPPPPPSVRLVLAITGKTFWQAWDPRDVGVDPTLRLQATLDEDVLVTFIDNHLNPEELAGAKVNSFGFLPGEVTIAPADAVQVLPPETRPGRIVLKIDVPAGRAGRHHLRLAYQVNEGSSAEPAWRDRAETALEVALKTEGPTVVQIQQDPGKMEFSGFLRRRRMKNVETFRMDAHVQGVEEPGDTDKPTLDTHAAPP
jgi:hypothetical protein